MKNTVDNAMFGLKTCTKVSTRDPKYLVSIFGFLILFFLSGVSKIGSARPNFSTLYYFTIYCWLYDRAGLNLDTFGIKKKNSLSV